MFRTKMAVAGLAICCAMAGCGKSQSGPQVVTFPVTGKILDSSGKPLTGGAISLRSVTNAERVASAMIDQNGQFKLTSLVGDQRVDGAEAGEYSVLYAPVTDKQTEPPVMLKKTYAIKQGQGELEIKLE